MLFSIKGKLGGKARTSQTKGRKGGYLNGKVKGYGARGDGKRKEPEGESPRKRRGQLLLSPHPWPHNLLLVSSCPRLPSHLHLNVSFAPGLFLAALLSPVAWKIMVSMLTHLASRWHLTYHIQWMHLLFSHDFHIIKVPLRFLFLPKKGFYILLIRTL